MIQSGTCGALVEGGSGRVGSCAAVLGGGMGVGSRGALYEDESRGALVGGGKRRYLLDTALFKVPRGEEGWLHPRNSCLPLCKHTSLVSRLLPLPPRGQCNPPLLLASPPHPRSPH